jgi:uncharacterized protein
MERPMPADEDLVALLACPRCRGGLQRLQGGAELVCAACRCSYPVRDGIPDLLPESARPLDLAGKSP